MAPKQKKSAKNIRETGKTETRETYIGFEEGDVVLIKRRRVLLLEEIVANIRHGTERLWRCGARASVKGTNRVRVSQFGDNSGRLLFFGAQR